MESNNKRHMSDLSLNYLNKIEQQENEANGAIKDLMANVKILMDRKDPLIKCIKSPTLLMRGLNELLDMVEMMDIKYAIANQIKFLITNEARKQYLNVSSNINEGITGSNFEGHMLHSVISGNPGTGKTTIAMILAKIWMALGFVKKKEDSVKNLGDMLIPIISFDNLNYQKRIRRLEENESINKRKLDHIKEILLKYQTLSSDVRRKLIKIRGQPCEKITELEWNSLINNSRDLKLGFDELIKEANIYPIMEEATDAQPLNLLNVMNTANSKVIEAEDPYDKADPKFTIAAREDLIAEYLGQTAPKTKKVLETAVGGVLFIDEAYSLCNMDGGSKDKYGEECLTTINEFMSLHPDEIIIIFAGYKDRMMNSIFKAQPGLYRRCAWFFEINDYSPLGLSKIFVKQLSKNSWQLDNNVDIIKLLSDNKDIFQDGGGGTDKLAFQAKIAYAESKFMETVYENKISPVKHDSIISQDMLLMAINQLRKNNDERTKDSIPPLTMYL